MIYMRVKLVALISLAFLSLVLSSCTSEGTSILGKQDNLSTTEDPLITNSPFAYDMAADTISYNSCVMQPLVTDPNLHGLKIGASEGFVDNLGTGAVKGGLKLRSDFLQYIGQKFAPDYPATSIPPSQILRILGQSYSVQNSNAQIQFAVRRKSDYAIVPDLITTTATTAAYAPRDATVFSQVLSSGFLGYSLTKGVVYNSSGIVLGEGQRIYNLSDVTDAIPIEGSFNFNASADETSNTPGFTTEPFGVAEIYSQRVRDDFNSNIQLLTSTFGGTGPTTGNPADDVTNNTLNNIKRPYKTGTSSYDATKAYGRGYYLKFESQTSVVTWPKNRLTQVSEINLDTGAPTTGASWTCEQFTIASPSHWNNQRASNSAWFLDSTYVEPNCAPLLSADTTCDGGDTVLQCNLKKDRAEKIKRIRRHYAVENWNIGLMFPARLKAGYSLPDRRTLDMCVSPKTASGCYLPTTGILASGETNPITLEPYDVGIQYDRTQDCYLTMATVVGNRDTQRKKGRCAQFASICTRSSTNF